jgi:hypothetical protein
MRILVPAGSTAPLEDSVEENEGSLEEKKTVVILWKSRYPKKP